MLQHVVAGSEKKSHLDRFKKHASERASGPPSADVRIAPKRPSGCHTVTAFYQHAVSFICAIPVEFCDFRSHVVLWHRFCQNEAVEVHALRSSCSLIEFLYVCDSDGLSREPRNVTIRPANQKDKPCSLPSLIRFASLGILLRYGFRPPELKLYFPP